MTFENTVAVLLILSRLNPAMRVVEGQAKEWHAALAEYRYEEVEAAARRLAYEQTWVGVADIRAAVKAARVERLAGVDVHKLAELEADPDDGPAYHAVYQRISLEISSGVRNHRGELEAGR